MSLGKLRIQCSFRVSGENRTSAIHRGHTMRVNLNRTYDVLMTALLPA